jgi:hypothetical protein
MVPATMPLKKPSKKICRVRGRRLRRLLLCIMFDAAKPTVMATRATTKNGHITRPIQAPYAPLGVAG